MDLQGRRRKNLKVNLYDTIKHPFAFLFEWRPYSPYRFIMYFFVYASVPMFAYGIKLYTLETIKSIIYTIIVLYSGFFAGIIWNDICDADIDAIVHPKRAIPKGIISKQKFFTIALIFSGAVAFFSYLINLRSFLFIGLASMLAGVHNKYLRRMIKLPAYSEIVTPLQWTIVPIFGFFAIEDFNFFNMLLLVAFTYFADSAHDIPEGIHDAEGDLKERIRTYTTSFGEKAAAKISFILLVFAGLTGIILFLKTSLTLVFLFPFLILWIYTLYSSYKFLKLEKEQMKESGLLTGLKIYRFFLATYVFIFLDISAQLLIFYLRI